MNHQLVENAEKFNKRNRLKKAWHRVVSVLGCVVVFCTTYALILPAITQERETFCGYEAHVHDDSCYTQIAEPQRGALNCSYESLGLHSHVQTCYDESGRVICGQADYVIHAHDEACADEDGNLICIIPEAVQHEHDDCCYGMVGAHQHSENCYVQQRGALHCETVEAEAHKHSEVCYGAGDVVLCTVPEHHMHEDACYELGQLLCPTPVDHTHAGDCFRSVLACEIPEVVTHEHTEECYRREQTCTEEENHVHGEACGDNGQNCTFTENHVHSEACFCDVLICEIPPKTVHNHTDDCYRQEIVCELEENHQHSRDCYEHKLTCTIEENHVHAETCYEQVLTCRLEETDGYQHTDACYEMVSVLSCGLEETHGEYGLICTQPEAQVHVHGDSCYDWILPETLTCVVPEDETHTHDSRCYGIWEQSCVLEEHTHELICYSDPNADTETPSVWENTFDSVELSGIWSDDIVSIAESQLGYRESTANYTVMEDEETTKGYTRYGAWYGSPYGDWCAMFASFCIHYAEVEGVPLDAGCTTWIKALSADDVDLYREAKNYDCHPGDLIFFDYEGDGLSDHVGIVYERIEATETETEKLKVIEGNSGNSVCVVTYELTDETILGYGKIPENPRLKTECGLEAHVHEEACYGADGVLSCTISEHVHVKACLESSKYFCGFSAHTHGDGCYDAEHTLICTLAEHTHDEMCMEREHHPCNLAAHTHEAACYDVEGNPVCGRSVHVHGTACAVDLSQLQEADRKLVEECVQMIEALPEADEIDVRLVGLDDAMDFEAEEAWLMQAFSDVSHAYYRYSLLSTAVQEYVVNREKLLEMEYIWAASPFIITEIAETIDYHAGMFTSDAMYVVYAENNGQYYAFDGNANAIPIQIDSDGVISADVTDKNTLLWSFTDYGSNSYLIRNAATGRYMHAFYTDWNNYGVTSTGAYRSTLEAANGGVRINGSYNYAYLDTGSGMFRRTSYQDRAAVYRFGVVYGNHTVWLDGTNGGLRSLKGSLNSSETVEHGGTFVLPTVWESPANYAYTLRGWYDVKNQVYYAPGAEITVTENLVLYADWVPATYNIGQFNSQVADTISTNNFITTHVFDYTTLINTKYMEADVTVGADGHSESWSLKDNTLQFAFIDHDADYKITQPEPRGHGNDTNPNPDFGDEDNTYTQGLFNSTVQQWLFGINNSHDPATGQGEIGKNYLGTGDHLFQYCNDPSDTEHYGYYYYDSAYNAASYNQSQNRFYVYDYLARTEDSAGWTKGIYSDFLPLNYQTVNTNGKQVSTYTYNGEATEYVGVTHYQYDSGIDDATGNVALANYWFGMSSEIEFYLPTKPGSKDVNGQYTNLSTLGHPMVFKFSGDDDIWITIDGVMVLDMGGVRDVQNGEINFSTGVVTINGYVHEDLSNALKSLSAGDHKMQVYYLERGSSMSNCQIQFNLSPRYSMILQKEDVLTKKLLDGAQFMVYTDEACTQIAQLWTSKEAHSNHEPASKVFTVENGVASMWGFAAGNTYYMKETKAPDNGYGEAHGIIKITLTNSGATTYDVIEDPKAEGEKISGGFTVHGIRVDDETQQAFLVITNGKNVTETIDIQVQKKWADSADHSNTPVTVYLWADGVKIREVSLNSNNDWKYVWENMPKYKEDGVTEVVYTVTEGVVPGYVGTVTKITEDTVSSSTWEPVTSITEAGTYLLKSEYGYLSAADNKLYWETDESAAQNSRYSRWYIESFEYEWNYFISLINEAGLRLYYDGSVFRAALNPSDGLLIRHENNGFNHRWNPYLGQLNADGTGQAWEGRNVVFELQKEAGTTTTVPFEGTGFRITNSPTTEVMSLRVNKVWNLGNLGSEDLYRQATLPVTLLKNGQDTGETVVLSLKNNWRAEFTGLPKYEADGSPIFYTVREDWNASGWSAQYGPLLSISGSNSAYETTITNVYNVTYILPETGGSGTLSHTAWGLGLTATALSGLAWQWVLRRRREERGPP